MTESKNRRTRSSRLVTAFPFYYGWIILAAGTFGLIMTSPGQTYSVSVFIEHFIEDLGLSRSLVSTLYTVGTLTGSLAMPFVGRQIDRRGPRVMASAIAALLGLACIYMGTVRGAVMLGFGFFAIRMLGQGSLELVCGNVINRWWVRRRGMAIGFAGLLTAVLGTGSFPSLIHRLNESYGWRTSYTILGIVLLAVMVPVGLVFFRDQPEDYGLEPDGGYPPGEADEHEATTVDEEHWTVREVVRSPVFWALALGMGSLSMLTTGLHFHMVGILGDSGLSPTVAATVFVPMAVTGALVIVSSGILVDRVPVRFLLVLALLLQATSLIMAQLLRGVGMAFVYGIILGATGGLQSTARGVLWPNYFGRRYLGSITGITYLITVAGSSLGPMPLGVARDLLGSYNTAMSILAILPLALSVICFFARPPRRVALSNA